MCLFSIARVVLFCLGKIFRTHRFDLSNKMATLKLNFKSVLFSNSMSETKKLAQPFRQGVLITVTDDITKERYFILECPDN